MVMVENGVSTTAKKEGCYLLAKLWYGFVYRVGQGCEEELNYIIKAIAVRGDVGEFHI